MSSRAVTEASLPSAQGIRQGIGPVARQGIDRRTQPEETPVRGIVGRVHRHVGLVRGRLARLARQLTAHLRGAAPPVPRVLLTLIPLGMQRSRVARRLGGDASLRIDQSPFDRGRPRVERRDMLGAHASGPTFHVPPPRSQSALAAVDRLTISDDWNISSDDETSSANRWSAIAETAAELIGMMGCRITVSAGSR